MSSSTIPKKLFEKGEFVLTNDPDVDHNNLVFMDSDSNDSDRLSYGLHMQDNLRQEVIDSGEDTLDGLDNNPMHVTIKREKECIIEDVPICLDKTDEVDESIKSDRDAVNSPDHSYYATIETIQENMDLSIEAKHSFHEKSEFAFTRLDPPVGMCLPPDVSEFIEEEQFVLITNTDDDTKKTEEESAAKDMSLVDHQYSQPEATNREFCDDLVQIMLQETGNDKNPAVLTLLSKFTEIFEHFVDEDKNSQMSLYIRSMKKTLKVLKVDEPSTSAAAAILLGPAVVDLACSTVELNDDGEDKRENIDKVVDLSDVIDFDEIIDIPATQPSDEPANDKANAMDEEMSISPENDNVVQHKINLTKVNDFALKLSGNVTDLMGSPLNSNESVAEGKKTLLTMVKESRKEFRQLILEIKSESVQAENEINEKSKNNLIRTIMDSSEWSNTESESDADQVVNLNRKIPKSGPQTPAIVSSTKEDSDISETEAAKAATASRSSSPESGTGKENIEKQIEKLLDFSTLACPKPASSKKISKPKKIKKLKKKRSSDIDSFLESSDNESVANQMSSSESERETSDEEQQMLMRQNADIKNSLLAGSSSDSDFSDRGVLSSSDASDSEPTPKKKEKYEKKVESPAKLPVDEFEAGNQVQDKTDENNVETLKSSATPAASPKLPADKANVQNGQADQTVTVDSDEEVAEETEQQQKQQPRKYIKRDSFEREIFSKDFLETNGNKRKASSPPGTSSSGATTPKAVLTTPRDEESSANPQGTIDVSMFDSRRTNKEIDLQKMIEKREKNLSGPSTSSSSNAKPLPVQTTTNDDEWISLSSDSDSEVSAPNAGSSPRMPRRKKMLTEEELQEETKRANKEETQRVKRLEKKNEALTQMLSERLSQDDEMQDEVILDYDSKTQTTIAVHPKLVTFLKNHQKEGIKFMYDTCYGSIADEVKTESGCILAHCMGLGKTLQLITLLHTLIMHPKQLKTKKVLVVCPKSTIMNWNEEFRKWLDGIDTNSLKVYYLDDQKLPERVRIIKQWYDSDRPGVFLINYEALRYMVNYSGSKRSTIQQPEHEVKRLQEIIAKCLLTPGPDLVVCDEGHLIKNQTGATNKAITKIDTRRRIILTGTPVQNNLNEYYAMVDWIKPALLGTVKEFNNLYANPIKDGQCKDSTAQDIKRMKQRSFILNRKLSKFVQRKEATVLKEFLPEKYEYCIFVPLTNVQEQLYEKFLRQNPLDGGHKLLNDYTALRKIWTHPQVLKNAYDRAISGELKISEAKRRSKNQVDEGENEEPDDLLDVIEGSTGVKSNWWKQFAKEYDLESLYSSNKLILLFEILRQCEAKGEKVLVFSAFVAVLNVVEDFMKKIHNQASNPNAQAYGYTNFRSNWREGVDYYRLDGSTKREARHQMVQKFNDKTNKQMRCFLISAKAGGQGINLIGANRCILLDTSWNPSADQQNIFRIYRLGQRKVCYVYRLIALGTMEEKVYSRSVTKQAMSGRVVDKLQIERHFRNDELSELYALVKTNYSQRPTQAPPSDDVLKYLIHNCPRQAFKYHDHDSLLENKPEQDLNEDEINEAWQLYEAESRGPISRAGVANGNVPLYANDLILPDMSNLNYLAAASQYAYAGNYFSPDFLNMPYDISAVFRNTNLVPSSSNALPSSSNSSSMIRNQLNMNMNMPPIFNYNMQPSSTAKAPSTQVRKRRQSTAKKPLPSANMESLLSLQQRYNGSLVRPGDDMLASKNSAAHLALLPDGDASMLRSSPSHNKNPSNGNRSVLHSKDIRTQKAPFNVPVPLNQPRKTPPTPNAPKILSANANPNMIQRISNAISSAFNSNPSTAKTALPVPRVPQVTGPVASQRTLSTSGNSPAMSRSSSSTSVQAAAVGNVIQRTVSQRTPSTSGNSPALSRSSSSTSVQAAAAGNIIQRTASSINLLQRPLPSTNLPQRSPSSNLSQRAPSVTNLTQSSPSSSSLNSVQRAPLNPSQTSSPRMISVKNVNSINSATTIKTTQRPGNSAGQQMLSKNVGKVNYTPQNRSSGVQQVAPRVSAPKVAPSQNVIPQKEPVARVQVVKQLKKTVPVNPQLVTRKIVMNPAQLTGTWPLKDTNKSSKTNPVASTSGKLNPISITKVNSPGTSARQDGRPQPASLTMPSSITVHKLQSTGSRSQPSQPPTHLPTANRQVVLQKRQIEPSVVPNPKRQRVGEVSTVKIISREEREIMNRVKPSAIGDIFEID